MLNCAQLQIILHKYHLVDKEPFTSQKQPKESDGATLVHGYPLAFLLSPHKKPLNVGQDLRCQIVHYLATCFEILSPAAKAFIPNELPQWGQLCIGNSGDVVQACGYHKLQSDGQDAAFVHYVLAVDQDADDPNAKPQFEPESQYGKLWHLFVLKIPPKTPRVNLHHKKD
ncbi:hypothetical protein B0J17DRAFT_715258 [Rhizoctonia solani]|nr:hypothetical protein B0J17DRAFT_715258 [Rhizoctonia solani]